MKTEFYYTYRKKLGILRSPFFFDHWINRTKVRLICRLITVKTVQITLTIMFT